MVWITGASSGIGAQLAVDMVAAGATVVISARRIDKLEAVAEQCAKVGNRPAVLPIDVTDHASQADAAASVLETYGKVDVLVLNAGLSQRSLAAETPLEVTRQLMELNFMSSVALSNEVLPSMMKRKSGQVLHPPFCSAELHHQLNYCYETMQIVVVSSLSGIFGTPVASSYSATKFALVS